MIGVICESVQERRGAQMFGLIAVFALSVIVDLIWLAFFYFNLDNAFDWFQDRPHILRAGVSGWFINANPFIFYSFICINAKH